MPPEPAVSSRCRSHPLGLFQGLGDHLAGPLDGGIDGALQRRSGVQDDPDRADPGPDGQAVLERVSDFCSSSASSLAVLIR